MKKIKSTIILLKVLYWTGIISAIYFFHKIMAVLYTAYELYNIKKIVLPNLRLDLQSYINYCFFVILLCAIISLFILYYTKELAQLEYIQSGKNEERNK